MKATKFLLFTIIFFSIISFSFANKLNNKLYDQIENNLLIGLEKGNKGLTTSCTYFLGEIKSNKAIIPLMKILKNSEIEEERIAAALALIKIESARGLYAVKQRINFDDSERVKRFCKIFYISYTLGQKEGKVFVEPFKIVDLNLEYKGIKLEKFINSL